MSGTLPGWLPWRWSCWSAPARARSIRSPAGAVAGEPPRSVQRNRQRGRAARPGPTSAAGPRQPRPRRAPRRPTPTPTAPKPTRTTAAAGTGTPTVAGCPQGEHQRAVETYLARLGGFGPVTVDGRQSAADCAAIKKFQKRYGIRPVEGRAGPTTARRGPAPRHHRRRAPLQGRHRHHVLRRPDPADRLGDPRRQGGRWRRRSPVPGCPATRTPSGTYTVNFRNPKEWSDPYEVWLPYWQHFTRRDRLPRDHHLPAQHVDRLARLRQPAARRRGPHVGAGQGRHPGGARRPPPRHLTTIAAGLGVLSPVTRGPGSDTLGSPGPDGAGRLGMTVDHDVIAEHEQAARRRGVHARQWSGTPSRRHVLVGWFLFGWLVLRQGFVDSVGESAGAGVRAAADRLGRSAPCAAAVADRRRSQSSSTAAVIRCRANVCSISVRSSSARR